MLHTWRWFGKSDPISLSMLKPIGVEGIVTALHEIPNGKVWPLEAILDLKSYIEANGLQWSVVESLPVSEAIKYGGKERDQLIDNYKKSLENLGKAGVNTVCYNFMPVIDWVRTELAKENKDGSFTLYFDRVRFAYFDCCILQRKGAENDYTAEEMQEVRTLHKTITEIEKEALIDTIIVKTQGFINGNINETEQNPIAAFKGLLALYDGINDKQLRENLKYFLEQVIPVAEKYGVNLCIHPDDPPFAVLGLPRIVGSEKDIDWILNAVDNPHNGLTFCAGSLSSGLHNDVPNLARRFVKRTHFAHLRSAEVCDKGNIIEASHLEGRGRLVELVRIFEKEKPQMPMRIDHGKLMLYDADKKYNPGYSFLGRMYALAQIMGIMAAVRTIDEL
ncbi:MAG: mannonate dehydratase [Bacteroidales bacterium]|nr:mannonate dehydratase [Bacteroidales bacterium]MCL2133313.1 mannonate dehydratase [Bacteroidales bacterium]